MVEGDPLDQVGDFSRFLANTFGNFGKRFDQNILEVRVHVLVCNFQRVCQGIPLNAEYFPEEARKEDRVACLVG